MSKTLRGKDKKKDRQKYRDFRKGRQKRSKYLPYDTQEKDTRGKRD